LGTGPVEASPAAIKAEVAKLEFLRDRGVDALDLSVLPAEWGKAGLDHQALLDESTSKAN